MVAVHSILLIMLILSSVFLTGFTESTGWPGAVIRNQPLGVSPRFPPVTGALMCFSARQEPRPPERLTQLVAVDVMSLPPLVAVDSILFIMSLGRSLARANAPGGRRTKHYHSSQRRNVFRRKVTSRAASDRWPIEMRPRLTTRIGSVSSSSANSTPTS